MDGGQGAGHRDGGNDSSYAAWERASTADLARPAAGVRVRDARPRLLGMHAAISVPGIPDDDPPQYVLRDVDTAEFGICARVKTAAQGVGSCCSSAGPQSGRPAARSRRRRRCCRLVAGAPGRASRGSRASGCADTADHGVAG